MICWIRAGLDDDDVSNEVEPRHGYLGRDLVSLALARPPHILYVFGDVTESHENGC